MPVEKVHLHRVPGSLYFRSCYQIIKNSEYHNAFGENTENKTISVILNVKKAKSFFIFVIVLSVWHLCRMTVPTGEQLSSL